MNRTHLIKLCKQAPKIGSVSHEEFVDYIAVLDQVRRVNGQWEKTEAAYMCVDGKVAMANEDHRRQGKRFNFEDPVILLNDEKRLTLLVAINSEIYGRRHGIATSRKVGGSPYEAAHPWEVAETSAIGRALSTFGYGVLPGSGLSSAEDVTRARQAEANNKKKSRQPQAQAQRAPQPNGNVRKSQAQGQVGPKPNGNVRTSYGTRKRAVSAFQREKIQQLFTELYPQKDVQRGIEGLFQQELGHGLNDASYEEGRRITAYLLHEKRRLEEEASEAKVVA